MFAYWNLTGTDLKNATLKDANFFRANLERADLSGADLTRCIFSQAVLTAANLSGANISRAFFDKAVTFGADLTNTITDRPTPGEARPPVSSVPQTTARPAPAAVVSPEGRFCTYCGSAIATGGSFCPACGKPQPARPDATIVRTASQVAAPRASNPPRKNKVFTIQAVALVVGGFIALYVLYWIARFIFIVIVEGALDSFGIVGGLIFLALILAVAYIGVKWLEQREKRG
jgi:hypothetical protein